MDSEIEEIFRSRQSILNGRTKAFTQFDAPGSDCHQASSARSLSIQVLRDAKQLRGTEMMRHETWFQRGGAKLTQQNLARGLLQRSVHEDHCLGCRYLFRHLRRPLVIAKDAHARIISPALVRPLS